jgi:hypothetical protein
MDWKLFCVIAAFAIYLIYNVVALRFFGVPKSLSMTYYLYKENKKDWMGVFFPIMMLSVVAFLTPAWLEISEGSNLQFTAFLAAGGIMFTGAAPAFKSSKLEKKVHTGSAAFAALFAMLWVALVAKMWYIIVGWLLILLINAIVTKSVKKSYIYWLETVAFLATFTSALIYYCK